MTITGRTTPKWGRDRSARWDSNPENGFRTRSYPHVETKPEEPLTIKGAWLPGRPGHAERALHIRRADNGDTEIHTAGWYPTTITLNDRQVRFLRDTLNEWLEEESHPR
jgi:hypothetical protein